MIVKKFYKQYIFFYKSTSHQVLYREQTIDFKSLIRTVSERNAIKIYIV